MSEMTREQIEKMREDAINQSPLTAGNVVELCRMALRTHDAEADRDNYRAKFTREQERSQLIEAERDRTRQLLREQLFNHYWRGKRERVDQARVHADEDLRRMLNEPPSEDEEARND